MTAAIPFKITVCGLDELPDHSAVGVSHVLSILDPGWPVPDAFGSFGEHERLELRFNDVIEDLPGMLAPQPGHVDQLLAFGREMASEPASNVHLLVHCHAGVSRSTASIILMLVQAQPEQAPLSIAREVLRVRPQAWPNLRIIEFGDAALRRCGALVAAATELYREQLIRRPELARLMNEGGRGREVAAARRAG